MNSLSACENRTISELSDIRNGILLCLQGPDQSFDLRSVLDKLTSLQEWASHSSADNASALASGCISVLQSLDKGDRTGADLRLRSVLDQLVLIEAELVDHELNGELFEDVAGFVDESFEKLTGPTETAPDEADDEFEIDAETLEIFREEATDLLGSISTNLEKLSTQPDDREAVWELRRAIHTLKGAVGIVGLDDAANVSHTIEDLLGVLVENELGADAVVVNALNSSIEFLNTATTFGSVRHDLTAINDRLNSAMESSRARVASRKPIGPVDEQPAPAAPRPKAIVRVSLDRLNELQNIVQELALTRTRAAEVFETTAPAMAHEQRALLTGLFGTQLSLCKTLIDKLDEIRMVRFGTLATRLSRAVNVTCEEDGKKAEVHIENEDVELDSQIIDALVEPLLHLLRNAVVHGIELPEIRRMIAKPERGRITISVDQTDAAVVVSVADNGRGINAARLKEKAVASGALIPQVAEAMTDEEAMELMFLRGVTTAETLSLNAGRGIGMSIVKESIESRGGKLSVMTQPQKGTTFTITFPIEPRQVSGQTIEMVHVSEAVPAPEPQGEVSEAAAPPVESLPRVEHEPQPAPDPEPSAAEVAEPAPEVPDIPAQPPAPEDAVEEGPQVVRVFVIDDSALMRKTITKVVERAGWSAVAATNGHEALRLLQIPGNRPNVIITDLEMPQHDGYGLIKDLKRNPQFRDIPVIMLTSRSERMHRDRALALGAARFFTKPLDSTELRAAVTQLLETNA